MLNEQAILDILDRIRNRFYGKYRGIVDDVEPGGRGRIKALVPAVLGKQATGWCAPCVPYAGKGVGMAFLPEKGSGVWIEFENGDVSLPIWTGCYWRDGELPSDVAPEKKVIRTKAGHEILFDDQLGSIVITDSNRNSITMNALGITIERNAGQIVILDGAVNIMIDGLVVTQ